MVLFPVYSPDRREPIRRLRCQPREAYAKQRDIASSIMEEAGWASVGSLGTFYAFPKIPDAQYVLTRLRNAGLHALPGTAFGTDYQTHLRFCFGKPVEELLAIRDRLSDAGLLRARQGHA